MKPTCDLCARAATRWYEPSGAARCGLHEYREEHGVALTRQPASPPLLTRDELARLPTASLVEKVIGLRGDLEDDAEEMAALREQVATVRPPADQRCPRCSRILIATPCNCVTPAERWVALQRESVVLWRSMTTSERLEAVRMKAAGRPTTTTTETTPCT